MRLKFSLKKTLTIIATIATLANSFVAPSIAIAQELSTPAPVDTSSPAPTVAPTENPTTTPEATPAETIAPSPEVTTTPTDQPTVAPTETPTVTQAPESNGPATPTTSPAAQSTTPTPTLSATPTATPETQENPSLASTILTTNVFPQTVQDNSWLKLITDKLDYSPTDIVVISGSGFIPNKDYTLEIVSTDAPPVDFKTQVKADGTGTISYSYQLDGNYRPNYTVYIKNGEVVVATITFTDSLSTQTIKVNGLNSVTVTPGATISVTVTEKNTGGSNWKSTKYTIEGQTPVCLDTPDHNGDGTYNEIFDITAPSTVGTYNLTVTSYSDNSCSSNPDSKTLNNAITVSTSSSGGAASLDQYANDAPTGWVNGDLNASKATYREGDSVPYRMLLSGIGSGSHILIIQWDTTKGGLHAIDYLTSFDRSVPTADPCIGVAGCGSPSTYAIPTDTSITGFTPISGDFTIYNGTITGVSAYTLTGAYTGDSSTSIEITFTATNSTPVIAWGGHIGSQEDWGTGNSASSISGSPYHMRLKSLDGSGGNQDRALAADAVLPTPIINTQVSASSIYTNGSVTDTATLTGSSNNSPAVTGNVNFYLCGPDISTNPDCTTGGTQVGSTKAISGGSATSDAYTATQLGNYCFRAEYVPDSGAQYSPFFHTNLTTECFNVSNPPTATLTLVKTLTKDNGGTALATDWTLSASGTASISGKTGDASITNATVNPDTYTLSESGPSGYTASDWSCVKNGGAAVLGSSITLSGGDDATCTINNDDQPGTLIIKKLVINDNGGSSTPSDFSFQVGNGAAVPFTEIDSTHGENDLTVNAGKYTVTEPAVSGYTTTYSNCTDVSVPNGGSATCTITNDDQQAYITVTKVVHNDHGGSALPDDFKLTLGGNPATSGVAVAVNPGTYTAGETLLPGYMFNGFSGACDSNGSVTVALGESKTCTLTNSDQQAYITVVKTVINDNGGAAKPDDFKLTLAGNPVLSGVAVAVNPGTYTAAETQLDGYSFSGFSGACGSDGKVTVALGESKTCTLTNNDNAPSLTLVKSVDNSNGGNNVATDWTLYADGPTPISGDGGATSNSTFKAGAYTLSEVGKTGTGGYIAGDWSCTGTGIQSGSSITLTNGQSATCTITNSALPAHITLNKFIQGSQYGDTATVNSFGLTVGTTSVTSGQVLSVNANTDLSLNEAGLSGYQFVSLTGDALCPSVLGGTVKLDEGQDISCTITNKAVQPHLIVIKHVVNDNGGSKSAANFTVNVTGNNVSNSSFAGQESPGTDVTLDVGLYSVDEGAHDGYAKQLSADCSGTIALGQTKTCTITNDDIAPTLKLVKNVSGGTSVPHDWTLTAQGGIAGGFDELGDENVFHTVVANNPYALSELGPTGYTASDWTCDNGQTGSSVSLDPGTNVTCSITNSRDTATLTINKTVIGENNTFDFAVNGPSASTPEITTVSGAGTTGQITIYTGNYTVTEPTQPTGWQLTNNSCTINGGKPFNGGGRGFGVAKGDSVVCNFEDTELGNIIVKKVMVGGTASFDFTGNVDGTIAVDGGTLSLNGVLPKNGFTSTESPTPGWVLTDISCNDGESTNPSTGDIGTGKATFNVDPGETVTCTFTNTKYGYMQGRKYVDSNMDGRLESNESFLDGWTVRLYNSVWQLQGSYTTGAGGLLTGQYKFGNLLPGIYNACEVQQTGYQQTGPVLGAHAVDYNGNQVNASTAVANGSGQPDEAPTCWQSTINGNGMEWLGFGNIQLGKIIVEKETNTETGDEFTFSSNFSKDFVLGSGDSYDSGYLLPGDYSVSELASNNWQLGSATCDNEDSPSDIHLGAGDIVTCRFINNELVPGVSITKSNDSGSGITAGATVTYTLNVKNTGSIDFNNVYVYDFLPGGFSYVGGSVAGADFVSYVGSKLTLNLSSLGAGETATITYKASTNSGLANGTYTNYATCQATYFEESTLPCDPANSNVTIGSGIGYSGNIQGQVLGASTELPATGSPTELLFISLAILGIGIFLNGYTMRKQKEALKKAAKQQAARKKTKRHAKK